MIKLRIKEESYWENELENGSFPEDLGGYVHLEIEDDVGEQCPPNLWVPNRSQEQISHLSLSVEYFLEETEGEVVVLSEFVPVYHSEILILNLLDFHDVLVL